MSETLTAESAQPVQVTLPDRKPEWLKVKGAFGENYRWVKNTISDLNLHSVCQEAMCPNIGECFSHKTATFLMLGNVCTRGCTFCDIARGKPGFLDSDEPRRIVEAVKRMGLQYVVLTSVTRDDLADGGAGIFAECVRQIYRHLPGVEVEVLVPDFKGSREALKIVLDAKPLVFNHNMETVERLYPTVRKGSKYDRSLDFLKAAKDIDPATTTKSGIMVGLGETWDEIVVVLKDLRTAQVDLVTIGQYLRPSGWHLKVERFYHPDEFRKLREQGLEMGFSNVFSGPLVRSSYHAKEQALFGHKAC
ncbi:MAG: lipoyl synthase [candidate division Zixibacteria bacterium RBG_16_50_21]|nr:MAG: lipoyl synthase [candidate division Zixibacteria bacterium RBG_16_50_21]